MDFKDDVLLAAKATTSGADWIKVFNAFIVVICVISAPFTLFGSLIGLLAVPFNSALASIANNTYRQKELTKIHLLMLADLHGLPDRALEASWEEEQSTDA